MRGADLLLRSLAQSGVEICFANPGTSEMHLVSALDAVPGLRPVLTLQENVASGAADGWGRMTGRPASTLLHLGPGLANALSNLHNAKRAATPIVNIVGEHVREHVASDPPLATDIAALARTVSTWVDTVASPGDAAHAASAAVTAALGPPGAISTLIVPSDASWGQVADADGERALHDAVPGGRATGDAVEDTAVATIARALASGEPAVMLVGNRAMAPGVIDVAARVAAKTGAHLCSTTFTARARRGAGSVVVDRLPYFPELVTAQLANVRHLILVDAPAPVAFFAYPRQSSVLVPDSCTVHVLASGVTDVRAALEALSEATGAGTMEPPRVARADPVVAQGAITPIALAQTISRLMPEDAIVSDEAITNRFPCMAMTIGARPHDWLCLTGGSLGLGISLALGAALAAPGRRVLNLQADGSAMYTPQALWSLAREGVDVTTVILKNRRYRILDVELQRLQLTDMTRGRPLTDLAVPDLDFVQLAGSMGVPATRVDTAEALATALERAFAEPGPRVVEALMVD